MGWNLFCRSINFFQIADSEFCSPKQWNSFILRIICAWKKKNAFQKELHPIFNQVVHALRTPRETFLFQKSQTFKFGQTNWTKIFWGTWGIFSRAISTILALWVPCPWENGKMNVLVFFTKTYKSQINPKYDIGRIKFGK